MHVPTDVLKKTQEGSAAMAMLQEVGHVFWFAELQSVIAVQHHFRTDYGHEPQICTGIWFWDYKLRTTGSPFHETSNLSCQQSCEWALLMDLGK
jgi:NADPH-dependent ferric siderophore reductase